MTAKVETKKRHSKYGPLAIGPFGNTVICIILTIFCLACVLPLLLVYITSFTDELAITRNGIGFFPETWSLEAYRMLFGRSLNKIIYAYRTTILLTVLGTFLSLWFMTMFAYACSRKDFKLRQPLTFFAYFTMLFSGGLVASYIVNTTMFHLRDSFFVLLLPGMVGAYNIIVLRTFFSNGGTESLIEAANDLGANPIQTFWKVTWKLSIPGVLNGIMMVFLMAISSFVIPKLLGGGQYMLIGNLIESQFISVGNWNFGSAISMILAVIILISMQLMRKMDRKSE